MSKLLNVSEPTCSPDKFCKVQPTKIAEPSIGGRASVKTDDSFTTQALCQFSHISEVATNANGLFTE